MTPLAYISITIAALAVAAGALFGLDRVIPKIEVLAPVLLKKISSLPPRGDDGEP